MTARTPLSMPTEPQAPERALPQGSRLDDYEIEQVLSQGSFALVYQAYDRALNLKVSIKEYMPDSLAVRGADGQVVLRAALHAQRFELGRQAFIGEAQTLARCQHPSLLGVSRILQRHSTVYRVMRQCPGPTLLAHRHSLAAVPDEKLLRIWLDGLLGALAALHDLGCVHGGVSPGNILVLPDGRPMLLDFDAVRTALISDHTQSMMATLVPGFAPSEQRNPSAGPGLGPWTDLYALAATMHFCVSGQLPPLPTGASPAGRFEPLRAVWLRLQGTQPTARAVPSWLDLVDACLAEVPQDRPQSVAQFQDLLAGAAAQRLPPPVPVPMPMPAPQPSLFSHDQPVAAPISAPTQACPPAPRPEPQTRPEPAPVAAPAPRPRIEPAAAAVGVRSAAAAAHARVITELDQTFALVAAQATKDAASAPVPLSSAEPAPGPAYASARSAAASMARRAPRRLWLAGAAVAVFAFMAVGLWLLRSPGHGAEPGEARATEDARSGAATLLPPPALPAQPENLETESAGADAAGVASAVTALPSAGSRKASAAPVRSAGAVAPDNPRALCGKRSGYALFQCMQTQCAKRNWTKHAQCQKLRQSQSLN